jgi:hypothetical protein
MKNNNNLVIFGILIVLILICVFYDNAMEGFFVPPAVNSAAMGSKIAAGVTSTSRMANTINVPKINNNMMGGGIRAKSAQEFRQSERNSNEPDTMNKLITTGAAVAMVNSPRFKPTQAPGIEGFENQFPNQNSCLLPLPLSRDVNNGDTAGGLQYAPQKYKLNGQPTQFDMVEQKTDARYPLFILP